MVLDNKNKEISNSKSKTIAILSVLAGLGSILCLFLKWVVKTKVVVHEAFSVFSLDTLPMVCAIILILLQLFYFFTLVRKMTICNVVGILSGILTLAFAGVFMFIVSRHNAQTVARINTWAERVDLASDIVGWFNGAAGTGVSLFGKGLSKIAENGVLKFTMIPIITALLGVVEAGFAVLRMKISSVASNAKNASDPAGASVIDVTASDDLEEVDT